LNDSYKYLAPFYSRIEKLVFGKTLQASREFGFELIKEESRILIVGGGDGRVLKNLPNCRVDYVESSKKMRKLARKIYTQAQINFIDSSIEEETLEGTYNHIFFQYFFDQFNRSEIIEIMEYVSSNISNKTIIHLADFQSSNDKYSHSVLIKIMYRFFGFFTGLRTRHLEDFNELFRSLGFIELKRREWKNGLVFATMWERGK